jgi:hypothetical protein
LRLSVYSTPREFCGDPIWAENRDVGVDPTVVFVAFNDSIRWEEETVVTTFLHCLSTDEFHQLLGRRGRIADVARAIVQGLQGALTG